MSSSRPRSARRRNEESEGATADDKAALDQKVSAVLALSDATQKSDQAKIDEIQKKMDALTQKLQQLASAGKVAEIEPAMKELARLGDEQAKLQGGDQMEAGASAATADLSRDSTAGFMVTVCETKLITRGFTACTVPVGKGFRKLAPDSRGNQRATIIVALPPKPGERGQTVARIDGDPARADALLQAAKLR